jgi:hypothetical protein
MRYDEDDDVKPDWAAIGKVGIPGVIALAFTWSTITGFDKFDVRLAAMEQQHAHAAAAAEAAKDLAGRALMTNERVLWVLRTMCANDAKTNDARERCLRE